MKYDRKIKTIIKDINELSDTYLGFVESANECAATDRLIESIIEKSKELENYHEKRFEHSIEQETTIEVLESKNTDYCLNFSYDQNSMTLTFFNDKNGHTIDAEEIIDYRKWSENRLLHLGDILNNKVQSLIEKCKIVAPNFIFNGYKLVAEKNEAKKIIEQMVKENNKKVQDIISKLDVSIKAWYIKEYPSDSLGNTLSSTATFLELNNLLNSHKGNLVYDLLGGDSDTVIRERCFQKLAELTEQNYETIYDKWMDYHKDPEQEEEIEK